MQGFEINQDRVKELGENSFLNQQPDFVCKAPISGVIVPLEQVPDPVFSQNGAGQGVAIDPTGEEVCAPCDGKVIQMHSAGHAIIIKAKNGVEILIHIGLDTVLLKGQGFNSLVKVGVDVYEGQPLIRFDADYIVQHAKSLLTVIVVTNSDQIESLKVLGNGRTGEKINVRDRLMSMRVQGTLSAEVKSNTSLQITNDLRSKSKLILIENPSGIHARPASLLVNLAKGFNSELSLLKGERVCNLRSLVGILSLEVAQGDYVSVEASGSDSGAAVSAFEKTLLNGFGEAHEADETHETKGTSDSADLTTQPKSDGQEIRGVNASPGRTVGRIYQLRSQEILIEEKGESEVHETERLKHAIYEARFQLETISNLLKKESDSSRALIFSAHQELLDDPGVLDIARRQLTKGKSAAFAWKLAFTETADQLSSLNNQLLAARATDVRDVGQRVLRLLQDVTPQKITFPEQCILVSEDLTPSDVAGLDKNRVLGLVTTTGGTTSHVAILARSLDIPAIAGADVRVLEIENGTLAVLDATQGELRINPSDEELQRFEKRKFVYESKKKQEYTKAHEEARTLDGRRIEIVANLKSPNESVNALELGAEGVGLLRTEFLFMNRDSAPTEEEQLESYLEIAHAFGKSRPLIIRTLDVGGDKPLRYLPLPHEENPFLGERGIRVSLNRPDVFRSQLRAILKAARAGNVSIMFPMISTLKELRDSKAILEEERIKLNANKIPIGIMVEVPSVAILAEQFARESDFFSIGSNDLTQYTLAIDRGHPKLAAQVDGLDPSILHLIDSSVRAAHSSGKWVGVCGGIASDPQAVPFLIGLGVDELSVSIPVIPTIKAQIRKLNYDACKDLAQRALRADSAAEIRSWVKLEDE